MFPYQDFFEMVTMMIVYYNPRNAKPFQCMFESAFDMIPKTEQIYQIIYEALQAHPMPTPDSSRALLEWIYKVRSYVHRQLYNTFYMDYSTFVARYKTEVTTISTWSHPTWKMIHYFAAGYYPGGDYALSYKAFVSCLQFILPCPKCRDHLRDNLSNHPIDDFFGTRMELFTWSYILHQNVNAQLKKKGISFTEAKIIYGLK